MIMHARFLVPLAILAAFAGLLIGCSSDDDGQLAAGEHAAAPQLVSVDPPDGAVDVPPTTAIGLKFDMPMDPASVADAFHLSAGDAMHAWMDSLDHHRPGRMGGHMRYMDHMMSWMDSLEHHGEFHWNAELDSCYFLPSDSLMPHVDHMIYLYGPMWSLQGTPLETDEFEYDGPMMHFQTAQ
jgi:hypothetical protein